MSYARFCRGTLLSLTASTALCWESMALAQTPVEGDPLVPADEAAPVASPVADPPTAADAATTARDSDQLQEIVVTADKRSTSLQDVPIAVTALSSESLNQAKVDTTSQLAQVTPNMVVAGVYENVLRISLRGVASNDFVQNMNPAIATYIDEVYMGLATGQALQFFDLERVEVLRGPQGTLYGKNATGGAISYFSRRPSTSDFEGGISATYGNYDRVEAETFFNVPLSEQAAIRFSGSFKDRDGIVKNTFLGIRQRFAESKAGRLQLLLKPTETITANLKVFASEFDGDVPHRRAIGIINPVTLTLLNEEQLALRTGGVDIHGTPTDLTPHVTRTEIRTFDRSTNTGASAHIVFDLGTVDFTSISAYEENKRSATDDPDGSPVTQLSNSYFNDSKYFSQELRLAGDIGRLDFIVGGHFYREVIDARLDIQLLGCTLFTPPCTILPVRAPGYLQSPFFGPFLRPGVPTPPNAIGKPVGTKINTEYEQINRSLAAFADVKFHVNNDLTLTGGLRYTTERRTIDSSSPNPLMIDLTTPSPLFPGYASFKGKETWDNLSGRAVVDYKFGDSMVYASYSRGFRAGNWNGLGFTLFTISEPVDPETLTSYEAGIKSELFDRRVRLNLTGYYYDYQDMQVTIFVNTQGVTRNAAQARVYGGEVEATALVTEGLTLRLSGGYTNARYEEFFDNRPVPGGDPRGTDLSGNVMPYAPDWTATGGFTFERPINDGVKLEASTDIRYQSKIYFNVYNFEDLTMDGYVLVNGRVGLNFDDKYSVALWARNLFDKDYFSDANSARAPFGTDSVVYGEPRMYGITASAKF